MLRNYGRARRDGDCYIVDGEKTFISSIRADRLPGGHRTGGAEMGGVSLLLIRREHAGVDAPR